MIENIYFHIGFPKTATTYLQRGVFRELKFLGNDSIVEGTRRLENDLREIICTNPPEVWKQDKGRKIVDRMRELAGDASDVYYSSEYWLRGPAPFFPRNANLQTPATYSHMALEHLRMFQEQMWKPYGNVHVMVTFRKQAMWLGSQYAQISNRRKRAGQSDFDLLMKSFVDDESPHGKSFLDYHSLYSQLVNLFGKERVLFLPVEEVGTELFWNRFERWSGLKAPREENKTESKKNVRRINNATWITRPRNCMSGTKTVVVLDEYLRHFGSSFKTKSFLKKIEKRLFGEGQIVLTPELEQLVAQTYSDSNRKLADEIQCDLSGHGYF